MYDPFAAALVVLHGAAGSVAAIYTPLGGSPLPNPIGVIRDQKTADVPWSDTRIPAPSSTWSIMRADVEHPMAGDTLTIGADVFTIVGEARFDDEGLSWSVEAPPA